MGLPRSGKTWVADVLGRTEGAVYVHEPDGSWDPFAFRASIRLGAQPYLADGDAPRQYERLWQGAFSGGKPAGTFRDRLARRAMSGVSLDDCAVTRRRTAVAPRLLLAAAAAVPRVAVPGVSKVVVKSANLALAADWVWERWKPVVVVVQRHPLDVLASWQELGIGIRLGGEHLLYRYARERWGIAGPGSASVLAQQAGASASSGRDWRTPSGAIRSGESYSTRTCAPIPVGACANWLETSA